MPIRPPTFRPSGQRTRRQTNAEYDARRGSARDRGYDARWDREAKAFRRLNPLCLGCNAVDRIEPATLVDHVIPHKGDQILMWNRENWQPSCDAHHDIVKQRLEVMYGQNRLKRTDLRLDSAIAIQLTRDLIG